MVQMLPLDTWQTMQLFKPVDGLPMSYSQSKNKLIMDYFYVLSMSVSVWVYAYVYLFTVIMVYISFSNHCMVFAKLFRNNVV